MTTIQEVFLSELKDLHSAESQLIKALPKMAKAAKAPELAKAFENHLVETQNHKERLVQIGEILGEKLTGETCDAMKGLVEEADGLIEEFEKSFSRDAALIAGAQRVEHYEIAAYGCTREMAKVLGHEDIVALLDATLQEEGDTDKLLTEVAVSTVLPAALSDSGVEADDDEDDENDEDEDEDYDDEDEDEEEDDDDDDDEEASGKSKTNGKSSAKAKSSSKSSGKSKASGAGKAKSGGKSSSKAKSKAAK